MGLPLKHFFQDNDGHVVLWQSPNLLLWSWITLKVAGFALSEGHLKTSFEQLGTTVLFAWAAYELAQGVTYFRKTLGLVILAIIILGYFV